MDKELKKKLWRCVDEKKRDTIKLCSDMIKIPSENPPGDMSEIASFIRDWLKDQGFTVETYEPKKGRINLVTKICGLKKPVLILNGHMDVVPAGDPKRWDFPPYCGEIKGGKVLGRGATDMKGGLASIIAAFTAVSAVREPQGTLILTIVSDEETGGEYGTKWLLDTGKIHGDACLIGENSSLYTSFIGEKGLCWLRLKSRGTSAHASCPALGENAIEKLMRALQVVKKVEKEKVKVPIDTLEMFEKSKGIMGELMVKSGIIETSKLKVVTSALDNITVNIGVIHGGTKINVVPDSCSAEVDVRVPIGTTSERVKKDIWKTVMQAGLTDIECEVITISDPNYTSPTERIYKLLSENTKECLGISIAPLLLTGSTDARFFRLKEIPAIHYGPGEFGKLHCNNEYVSAENIIKVAKVLAGTISDFFLN